MTRGRVTLMPWWKGVLGALTAALFTPSTSGAQSVQERRAQSPLRRPQVCDMRYKMLMVTVVDAAGAPVPGVRLHIEGMTAAGDAPAEMLTADDGRAQLAEDSDLQFLPPEGAAYTLRLQKGKQERRVKIRLGRDAAGCHIALLEGASTIRF